MVEDIDESEFTDYPSNLLRCDPETGGCGTLFAPDIPFCPHCQLPVERGEVEDVDAGTETEQRPVRVRKMSTQDVQLPKEETESTDR